MSTTPPPRPDAIKLSAATALPFPCTLPFQPILCFVNIQIRTTKAHLLNV